MSGIDTKNSAILNDILITNNIQNKSEIQIKQKNDFNNTNKSLSKRFFNNTINLSITDKKRKNSLRIPSNRLETNIKSILHGKPLNNVYDSNFLSSTKNNLNKSLKANFIYSADTSKIFKSSDRNLSGNNSSTPSANQKNVSNNKNTNSNFFTNDSVFVGNLKLINQCKNFNTISNIDTEGLCSSKNKCGNSFKIFGNNNTTNSNNTYNNNNNTNININNNFNIENAIYNNFNISNNEFNSSSSKNDDKKLTSLDNEKTKSIANNKTDFKTLISNNYTSKQNTINSAGNSRFNKFEVKLLTHFNNLKNHKSSRAETPNYRENLTNKKTNFKTNNIKKQSSRSKKQTNPNAENENNINILRQIINKTNIPMEHNKENTNNNSKEKLNKNSFNVNSKINLQSENNSKTDFNNSKEKAISNKNYNSIEIKDKKQNFDDEKIKILLSEKFKFSSENSNRINKSSNSSSIKINQIETKMNLFSFDLGNRKENGRSLSIGERLYRKSNAMKSIKEKKASIQLYKKDIETINNCSFKPKLCDDSIKLNIKSRYATINDSRNTEITLNDSKDFSNSYFVRRNSKLIESYKLKKEYEDIKEMKPAIKRPQSEIKKHVDKLHNEKFALQVEREKLVNLYFSEIYPFKPTTNNTEKLSIEGFFDRLQSWVEKRNESYKKDIASAFFDKETGKKLFKPSIAIPAWIDSIAHRNELDLYTFLHLENKTKAERLSEINQEGLKSILKNSQNKLSNQKTDEINKLLKEDCYANLFEILDHNNDGVISCTEEFMINAMNSIDKALIDMLKPIFEELKEHKESLTREEFYLALDELFKCLSVQERRHILNWYVEKKRVDSISRKRIIVDKSNFTFKPFVSERSHSYFSFSKRHAKDFILRNKDLINSREVYFNEKSQEKNVKEIEGCTFKPEINKNSEKIDMKNKSAFFNNLNNIDLDFLLKSKSVDSKRNL